MTFSRAFASLGAAVGLVVSLAGMPAQAAETSPFVGTWVMNVAKSHANPPGMKPKSDILKTEMVGEKFKTTEDIVGGNGMVIHSEVTYALDGKDNVELVVPEPPPEMGGETVAVKGINERTHEVTIKNGGKTTIVLSVVVSEDGKTLTTSGTGTLPDGTRLTDVRVFDRQK